MDLTKFASQIPGRLVPTEGGRSAFVPDPLPARFELSREALGLYAEALAAVGELRGVTSSGVLTNPGILLRPLQREESLRSSSLEGTYASAEELLLFELDSGDADTPGAGRKREVYNYDRALRHGEEMVVERGFSNFLIRALHQQLLEGVRGQEKSPGEFRRGHVQIGADARFIPPPGHLVLECMDALQAYMQDPRDQFPPLVRAFLVHYQFETIHPFRDGNGRVGRLLLSLMIARWCELERPWLLVSEFLERNRDAYFGALFDVSARGDWDGWVRLCMRATAEQSRSTIARCRALLKMRARWNETVRSLGMSVRIGALLDHLLATPIINVSGAREVLGVGSVNTARADLERLAEAGLLTVIRESHPRTYLATEVLDIVHRRGG